MLSLESRFGPLGRVVADSLRCFSLDLVGLVSGYLMCGMAKEGADPKALFSIGTKVERKFTLMGMAKPLQLDYLEGSSPFLSCCSAIAYDTLRHQLWVGDARCVQIFDVDSRRIRTVDSRLGQVSDIVFHPDDRVYLSYFSGPLSVCTPQGDFLHSIELGLENNHIAIDQQQRLLVASENKDIVLIIDKHDQVSGKSNGKSYRTMCMKVAASGELYSVQNYGHSISVYDSNGKFSRTMGKLPEEFLGPWLSDPQFSGLAFDASGNVIASEELTHRVYIFQPNGTFIASFGGEFIFKMPRCVCVDPYGRIFVGDNNAHVHVFAFE